MKPTYPSISLLNALWSPGNTHLWLCNEEEGITLHDTIGSADLTIADGITWVTAGVSAEDVVALSCDGSQDGVEWGIDGDYTNWSIAFKVRMTNLGTNQAREIFRSPLDPQQSIFTYNDTWVVDQQIGSASPPGTAQINTDYIGVACYDHTANHTKFYLDGALLLTIVGTSAPLTHPINFFNDNVFHNPMTGLCMWLRVWNRTLTADDVVDFTADPYADVTLPRPTLTGVLLGV